jgi:hypothetical protein
LPLVESLIPIIEFHIVDIVDIVDIGIGYRAYTLGVEVIFCRQAKRHTFRVVEVGKEANSALVTYGLLWVSALYMKVL